MRGAIFAFFALCLLLFLALLEGRHSYSTPGNYCCLFPLLCVFLWMYRLISVVTFSWTGNGQEWTWCRSRMDIRVCVVFSLSVFLVCTIFICAVFLWAPEHLCDLGLDLGNEPNERETNKLHENSLSHLLYPVRNLNPFYSRVTITRTFFLFSLFPYDIFWYYCLNTNHNCS